MSCCVPSLLVFVFGFEQASGMSVYVMRTVFISAEKPERMKGKRNNFKSKHHEGFGTAFHTKDTR